MPLFKKPSPRLSTLLHGLGSLAFGIMLCVLLFDKISFEDRAFLKLISHISWGWAGLAFLTTLGLWEIGALKWHMWDKASSSHHRTHQSHTASFYRRHFAWQLWWGQFLPSSLVVIMGRSWASRHADQGGWSQGAGSGLYDQILEFLLLSSLLPAAYVIFFNHASFEVYAPLSLAGLSLTSLTIWGLIQYFPRLFPQAQKTILWPLLGLSALRVLLIVGRTVLVISVFNLPLEPSIVIATSPLLAFLFILPLSPANLGVAEWGWVGVLSLAGYAPSLAALFALGSRGMVFMFQTLLLFLYEMKILYTRLLQNHG